MKYQKITSDSLHNKIGASDCQIIDIRPGDAYNGWPMQNENRGGHIRGARSLPIKWSNYMDWIEIVRSKGILPHHEIIIYGYSFGDCKKMAALFFRSGYLKISIYTDFLSEWCMNEKYPMDRLSRFKNLLPAQWVKDLIEGKKPASFSNHSYVIVHSHYRNRNAYLSGHIPGAIDMDTLALEAPETWNRRSPSELKKSLEEHGITADTTVVLYGKYMDPDNDDEFPGSAAGHIGAIRNAFIMMYAGVKDVRILNGGFQSWIDEGFDVSTEDVTKEAVGNFGLSIPAKPWLAVDVPQAKQMIQSPDAEIVCTRSWPEYIGEVSGYNYIEKKGRIPGAVFVNCGTDAYHMENYRNLDHSMREYHETLKNWKAAGVTPNKHLAFYCGTGWRGSEAFLNAWLMGFPKVSVFDGGWFEWSNDPANPIEKGIPQ
jgi:3-mercaptopyruvate sulfurtransferase SseA